MSPTNYQRGRAFEYRVRNDLIERGAVYVMRAAQSKGLADLIALFPHGTHSRNVWLVQCKTGTARMTLLERTALAGIAADSRTVAMLAQPGPNNRGVEYLHIYDEEDLHV